MLQPIHVYHNEKVWVNFADLNIHVMWQQSCGLNCHGSFISMSRAHIHRRTVTIITRIMWRCVYVMPRDGKRLRRITCVWAERFLRRCDHSYIRWTSDGATRITCDWCGPGRKEESLVSQASCTSTWSGLIGDGWMDTGCWCYRIWFFFSLPRLEMKDEINGAPCSHWHTAMHTCLYHLGAWCACVCVCVWICIYLQSGIGIRIFTCKCGPLSTLDVLVF